MSSTTKRGLLCCIWAKENLPRRRGCVHAEVTLRSPRHVKRALGSAASLACNVIPAPKPAPAMGNKQAGSFFPSCQAGLEALGAAKGLSGAAPHTGGSCSRAGAAWGCCPSLLLPAATFWSLNQGISWRKSLQKMQQYYTLQLSPAQKAAWGGVITNSLIQQWML